MKALSPLGVLALLAALAQAFAVPIASAAPAPRVTSKPTTRPATYALLEWRVVLDRKYDNPFDPDQIALDATFAPPDGSRARTVPAFWNGNSFAVRFAAPVAGKWKVTIVARDHDGVANAEPIEFDVAPADKNSRGFVHRSGRSSRYFEFDSGEVYFPIGLNIAWANQGGLGAFENWFAQLSAPGGNFARIWICHPNRPYETKQAGPGRYDLEACAFYDDLLAAAQRQGIHCMLTFNNHRDLLLRDEYGVAQWPEQPYNSANGGPCTQPADFITNPEAQRLYRNRLRYTVARWSAYTSVFCWEFWNEQSFTRVDIPASWTQQMARYLKSIDAFGHPVSTSFGQTMQPETFALPEIDLVQEHLYPGASSHDCVGPVSGAVKQMRAMAPDKPALVAELGIGDGAREHEVDPYGIGTNLHNAMWSSIMSGSCGAASLWWWDSYVGPRGLWWQYKPVADFVPKVDWPNRKFEPITLDPPLNAERSEGETFTDITIPAGGGWQRSHGQPIVVLPNGQALLNLPRYLHGPVHKEIGTPTLLSVDVPRGAGDTKLIVRVATVQDVSVLRVLIDDEPATDFFFSALPDGGGEVRGEARRRQRSTTRLATFNRDCAVPLPAGKHAIELRNVGGDWLTIESVTIANAKSSKYADLHVTALHDAEANATIGWLHDPASNWFNDSQGQPPRTISGATMTVPTETAGAYRVEWWDTWKGRTIRTDEVNAAEKTTTLAIPPVRRDVAFRVWRDGPVGSGAHAPVPRANALTAPARSGRSGACTRPCAA